MARLILLASALRLVLPCAAWWASRDVRVFLTADSPQYLAPAVSLWNEGRYDGPMGPELLRPPGYPLLLLGGVALGAPIAFALLSQAVLGALTAAVVYRAVTLLTADSRAAWWAGLLCASEPVQLVWGSHVMAETLLTALVSLALLLFLGHIGSGSQRALLLGGLALCGAAFVKPIGYFLPAWVALLLLHPRLGFADPARRRKNAAALLALCAVPLAAWQVRNGVVAGYWGFSSQLDRVLSFSTPSAILAAQQGRRFLEVRQEIREREQRPGFETLSPYGRLRRKGLEVLLGSPATYLEIHVIGVSRTLLSPGVLPLLQLFRLESRDASVAVLDRGSIAALRVAWDSGPLLLVLGTLLGLSLFLHLSLAGWALFSACAPDRPARLFLGAVALYFLVLSGGPWGQSRFRHPLMPTLAILAGAALARPRALP